MKTFIKNMLSNNDNVSSNRLAFLIIIICIVLLVVTYILIAIKGVVWNIPVIDILDLMNVLILGILSCGIITKNVAKFFEGKIEETKKEEIIK